MHREGARPSITPAACTIAISREAGALGSSVGQELAGRLGWKLYDQELLERIAARMGLRPSLLDNVDEQPANWARELLQGLSYHPGPSAFAYVHHLLGVLGSLAERGGGIIVGRAAPHVLPAESTLRVRLTAPKAFRVSVIRKDRGMAPEEARRWVEDTDRARSKFVKECTGKDPSDPGLYDLVINVARFAVPHTATIILDALDALEQARGAPARRDGRS